MSFFRRKMFAMIWLKRFLGAMSPVQIGLYSLKNRLFGGGRHVGSDAFGNVYFAARLPEGKGPAGSLRRERRWVMYEGDPEASRVPPEWHGWLHYQTDVCPGSNNTWTTYRRKWQKPHRPNPTGTAGAYHPPGSLLCKHHHTHPAGKKCCESWAPPENV